MERFKRYSFIVPSQLSYIQSLNYLNDNLWEAFKNFYIFCFSRPALINNFSAEFPEELVRESHKYFEEIKNKKGKSKIDKGFMADQYFKNFIPLWNISGKRNKNLWIKVWQLVNNWDKQKKYQIHKGALFYLWSATDLFCGDYDEGMILMHKALNEDRRKDKQESPDTQANIFVSMDENKDQFLQEITKKMAQFVKERLEKYEGGLDYGNLRNKFFNNPLNELEDIKYLFSYAILRLIKLRRIHKARNLADKQMSSLIFFNTLSSLILVIDELFKIVYKSKESRSFAQHVYYCSCDAKVILCRKEKLKAYLQRVGISVPDHKKIRRLNLSEEFSKEFMNNKYVIFRKLLDLKLKDTNDKLLSKIENQLILCYCLRNFTAHKIKGVEIFWKPKIFTDLLQYVFNVFFMAAEKLPSTS